MSAGDTWSKRTEFPGITCSMADRRTYYMTELAGLTIKTATVLQLATFGSHTH
jgi:hypothetical protein